MKTRIKDFLDTSTNPWSPVYSFQYATGKRPSAGEWRYVDAGDGKAAYWRAKKDRDTARECFSHRRDAQAAVSDMKRLALLPTT